jgi:ABC-type polysaccharide/polyol phosphate export permease
VTVVAETLPLYDSAATRRGLGAVVAEVRGHAPLLGILVRRDLAVRYRRSTLGVWWTLLNPILTCTVMWLVLSGFFRVASLGMPYVVYLFGGVAVFNFASQSIQMIGVSLVSHEALLSRMFVPAEVPALATGVAAAVNTGITLLVLLVLQVVVGLGIPWTAPLGILAFALLGAFAVGTGLLVASAGVRFHDALGLVAVVLQLLAWLTPTFYPLTVIPEPYRWVILANPLTHYLELLRDLLSRGELGPLSSWAYAAAAAVIALGVGLRVFPRMARSAQVAP